MTSVLLVWTMWMVSLQRESCSYFSPFIKNTNIVKAMKATPTIRIVCISGLVTHSIVYLL